MDFITDIFLVPEGNGIINICLQTNAGSQEELAINVMATVKTTGNDLACKIVYACTIKVHRCVTLLLLHFTILGPRLPSLQLLTTLFLGCLASFSLQVVQDRFAACGTA